MEKDEKTIRNIYEVTNRQFTQILNFLKDGDPPEDNKKINEIKSKVGQYMVHGDELYIKTTLGLGVLHIAK